VGAEEGARGAGEAEPDAEGVALGSAHDDVGTYIGSPAVAVAAEGPHAMSVERPAATKPAPTATRRLDDARTFASGTKPASGAP
jgi:hypothetical protein